MILQEKQYIPAVAVSIDRLIQDLKKRGYQSRFRREATCLYCIELKSWILPDGFIVNESYHFADDSNPDVERTIYAISTIQGYNGFLVDTCLVYEDNISPDMRKKLDWDPEISGNCKLN